MNVIVSRQKNFYHPLLNIKYNYLQIAAIKMISSTYIDAYLYGMAIYYLLLIILILFSHCHRNIKMVANCQFLLSKLMDHLTVKTYYVIFVTFLLLTLLNKI
jgi:hypothetical protein